MPSIVSFTIIVLNSFTIYALLTQTAYAQPFVSDTRLNVEAAVEGLSSPTSMAFVDDNNLLILEKEGNVRLVLNGVLQEIPLLKVPVNTMGERGLLGIAVDTPIANDTGGSGVIANVYLYFTEADPLRNRVYKYQWNGQTLINPTLILDLPAEPGTLHNGGKVAIGPYGYLYTVIGSLIHEGQLQNHREGSPPGDTGVIFRIDPKDGAAAPGNPFANGGNNTLSILNKYYAYGIRNSFGIDWDPLTGNLWNTENGENSYDEMNMVRAGFNSGWDKVMGPISLSTHSENELVNFPGFNYSDPVFSWRDPVGLTDIEFFTSSRLGDKYTNNIFVGDINRGNIYFFEVNQNRDGVKLNNIQQAAGLSDLIVDSAVINGTASINEAELSAVTFGSDFGGITDIETGPDGLLYVLSFGDGKIYKISPSINLEENTRPVQAQRIPTTRNTDYPFTAVFYINGVDNATDYIVNWVTANNVTEAISLNATEADLMPHPMHPKDGFVETSVSLPNGTVNIGDKYKACTMVPKHMYRVCHVGFNWPTNRPEPISIIIPSFNGNFNGTTNPEITQRTERIDETPFRVASLAAGVNNDTGYIVNWFTANNVTRTFLWNASDLDLRDERQDGFIQMSALLPNGTVNIGDKYKACIMVLKYDNMICNTGFNWPTDKIEYNSYILPTIKNK